MSEPGGCQLDAFHEFRDRQFLFAALLALRVERGLQEGHGRDARNLDRILKSEEQALGSALVGRQLEHVLAVQQDFARQDLVFLLAGDDIGERRLAAAVRPHDGGDFARRDGEVEIVQDLPVADRDIEVLNFEHLRSFTLRRRNNRLPYSCGR